MIRTRWIVVLTLFPFALASAQENWAQWRGETLNGISTSKNVPVKWSESENVVWKVPLPSWSGGTPIIWGDRIFVTSAAKAPATGDGGDGGQRVEDQEPGLQQQQQQRGQRRGQRGRGQRGRRGAGGGRHPGGDELLLLCFSKKDGKELWRKVLDTGNELQRKQNMSSPSPVTDGKTVWVMTGTGAVAAFDFDGNELWTRNIQEEYGDFGLNWGYGSSPLLHDGNLIIQVLHGGHGRFRSEPRPDSYLVGLDGKTGKNLWKLVRPTDATAECPDAYGTPALLEHEGDTQFVIVGGNYVTGHDVATGKEIWRSGGLNPRDSRNYRIVGSVTVKDGLMYVPSRSRPILALRAGGKGDITDSHLVWKYEGNGGPDVPTSICDGNYFYMVNDRGLVTCLNAKTGSVVWGPERTATGAVSASPLLADGKLYVTNESGITTVLEAGPEFKVVATNELDDSYTLSSIAVSGSQFFIRTSGHLYCIGKPGN